MILQNTVMMMKTTYLHTRWFFILSELNQLFIQTESAAS